MQSTEYRKLFKSEEAQRMLGVKDDEETSNPKFKYHTVFVQSQGIGRRPLFEGTILLYDVHTRLTSRHCMHIMYES